MKKTYVLDTSALIESPTCFHHLDDSEIIIPVVVLSELDNLKKQQNEVGKNARVCIKELDQLNEFGNLGEGVPLSNGSIVRVDTFYQDLTVPPYKEFGDPDYGDTKILACAYLNWLSHPNHDVTLLSNDINLRIKAKARGMDAFSYNSSFKSSELYMGYKILINEDAGLELQKNGFIDPEDFGVDANLHECIHFQSDNGDGIALGRKVSDKKIKLIKRNNPWGINSKSKEQAFAIDLLMDKGLDLVTLIGKSGSGKTLLALAAAMELVVNRKEYNRLIVYRPTVSIDEGIGFLPGTMDEKLAPWIEPIMDNFEVLLNSNNSKDKWKATFEMLQKKGQIEISALSYIRGRSLPNCIILCDESQNLSRHQIKTLLTRAGEGTKIILTGDIEQIDSRDLDPINNGLTYVVDKFKTSDIAGHITLMKGERSRLASLASEIL